MSRWREQIPGWIVASALTIVLLSGFDAYITWVHIQAGIAEELNPLMAWAMSVSPKFFVWLKMLMTGAAVFCLCLWHKHKLAQLGLIGVLSGYILLTGWHIFMHIVAV